MSGGDWRTITIGRVETETMSEELKKCPFCGGPAYYTESVNGSLIVTVGCDRCGVHVKAVKDGYGENPRISKDIVAVWNSRAEVERLQKWIGDLQSGMYVNCVYCGYQYGPKETTPVTMADALKAHIEVCEKHPMSALRQETERLKSALQAIKKHALHPWETTHPPYLYQAALRTIAIAVDEILDRSKGNLAGEVCGKQSMSALKREFEEARKNLEIMDSMAADKNRLTLELAEARKSLVNLIQELEDEYSADRDIIATSAKVQEENDHLRGDLEQLEKKSACYRAILEALEFPRLDDYSDPEFARMIGKKTLQVIQDKDATIGVLTAAVDTRTRDKETLQEELEQLKRDTREVCICAAVRLPGGCITRGHRHEDCFQRMLDRKIDRTDSVQGFITSRNRFVDRAAGRRLQDAAGLTSADPEGYEPGTLLSEDLY